MDEAPTAARTVQNRSSVRGLRLPCFSRPGRHIVKPITAVSSNGLGLARVSAAGCGSRSLRVAGKPFPEANEVRRAALAALDDSNQVLADNAQSATFRVKRSARAQHAGSEVLETFDPRDLLARILIHVAEPRAHLVRHYGEYAVAARAKRRRQEQPIEHGCELPSPDLASDHDPSPAERRSSRRAWAQLIRRIFESDPLLCDCGAQMKIIAVITEPSVVDGILRLLHQHHLSPGRDPPTVAAAEPF